jgi:DNA-binding MarR family transcriptional regulator
LLEYLLDEANISFIASSSKYDGLVTSMTPRQQPLTAAEEAFVRALGRILAVVPRVLEADLMHEQRMALSEYTALMHLSEAPQRHLRMSELAAACDLSLSGMTRVVSRLERDGLLRRVKCAEDARGSNAELTDAGLARLERAYPTHLASVRRHITDHLDGFDLTRLARALESFGTTVSDPRRQGARNAGTASERDEGDGGAAS